MQISCLHIAPVKLEKLVGRYSQIELNIIIEI